MALKPAPDWLIERPIAHRGWHDLAMGRAENSLSAFRAAVDAGFAIECDLQISADGVPVVFHDAVLGRMTGIDGNVRDRSLEELAQIKLAGTEDGIYSLKTHLDLVNSRVPIVAELKGIEGQDKGFVEGVAKAVSGYDGPLAVMSFDHHLCAQFAGILPDLPRGLTAEGGPESHDNHWRAMQNFDMNFVSYDVDALPNAFVQKARDAGMPIITWTVRTSRQIELTYQHADQMTFEGFDPRSIDE